MTLTLTRLLLANTNTTKTKPKTKTNTNNNYTDTVLMTHGFTGRLSTPHAQVPCMRNVCSLEF